MSLARSERKRRSTEDNEGEGGEGAAGSSRAKSPRLALGEAESIVARMRAGRIQLFGRNTLSQPWSQVVGDFSRLADDVIENVCRGRLSKAYVKEALEHETNVMLVGRSRDSGEIDAVLLMFVPGLEEEEERRLLTRSRSRSLEEQRAHIHVLCARQRGRDEDNVRGGEMLRVAEQIAALSGATVAELDAVSDRIWWYANMMGYTPDPDREWEVGDSTVLPMRRDIRVAPQMHEAGVERLLRKARGASGAGLPTKHMKQVEEVEGFVWDTDDEEVEGFVWDTDDEEGEERRRQDVTRHPRTGRKLSLDEQVFGTTSDDEEDDDAAEIGGRATKKRKEEEEVKALAAAEEEEDESDLELFEDAVERGKVRVKGEDDEKFEFDMSFIEEALRQVEGQDAADEGKDDKKKGKKAAASRAKTPKRWRDDADEGKDDNRRKGKKAAVSRAKSRW